MVRTVQSRDWRNALKAGALMAVCVLVATVPGPFAPEAVDLRGELYFGVGRNFYRLQDWPKAAENLQKSVTLDPRAAAPRNFLGISLVRLGNWDAACAQFDTARSIDPTYGEARRNLERCLAGRRDRD